MNAVAFVFGLLILLGATATVFTLLDIKHALTRITEALEARK